MGWAWDRQKWRGRGVSTGLEHRLVRQRDMWGWGQEGPTVPYPFSRVDLAHGGGVGGTCTCSEDVAGPVSSSSDDSQPLKLFPRVRDDAPSLDPRMACLELYPTRNARLTTVKGGPRLGYRPCKCLSCTGEGFGRVSGSVCGCVGVPSNVIVWNMVSAIAESAVEEGTRQRLPQNLPYRHAEYTYPQ